MVEPLSVDGVQAHSRTTARTGGTAREDLGTDPP